MLTKKRLESKKEGMPIKKKKKAKLRPDYEVLFQVYSKGWRRKVQNSQILGRILYKKGVIHNNGAKRCNLKNKIV